MYKISCNHLKERLIKKDQPISPLSYELMRTINKCRHKYPLVNRRCKSFSRGLVRDSLYYVISSLVITTIILVHDRRYYVIPSLVIRAIIVLIVLLKLHEVTILI